MSNTAGRTNLFCHYRGGAPVMLSNLRFNVETTYQTDNIGPVMVLKILPRRVSGEVDVALIDEMSVLLPEVEINPYTEPNEFVQVTMNEYYTFQSTAIPETVKVYLDPTPQSVT